MHKDGDGSISLKVYLQSWLLLHACSLCLNVSDFLAIDSSVN